MLGFEPPVDRHARREWWRRQVERQQRSHLSVAEFCRRHGINQVTFYSWRRRFSDASAGVEFNGTQSHPVPNPALRADFVPVSILDFTSAGQLEIAFGGVCTLRLMGTVDPKLLRVAILAAGQTSRTG